MEMVFAKVLCPSGNVLLQMIVAMVLSTNRHKSTQIFCGALDSKYCKFSTPLNVPES